MTEEEGLSCTDIERLLSHLKGENKKRLDRKARLFACASARRVWVRMDAKGRNAVDVAEQFADGLATTEELTSSHDVGMNAWSQSGNTWPVMLISGMAVSLGEAFSAALYTVKHAPEALIPPGTPNRKVSKARERRTLHAYFTEVFGNPLRPVTIDPAWLTPTVTSLATVAYEERSLPSGELDPARLAVLADALEEAGCTDADLLGHLRGPGPHVRGCWALDAVLGRS